MKPQTDPVKDARRRMRARDALLWVVSGEERRAEKGLADAGAREGCVVYFWDCAMGVTDIEGHPIEIEAHQNPVAVLEQIRADLDKRTAQRDAADHAAGRPALGQVPELWILRDLPELWGNSPELVRLVKSTARELQDQQDPARFITLAILTTQGPEQVPPSLKGETTVIDWPLPTRAELAAVLDDVAAKSGTPRPKDREREAILEAAAGLPSVEAENAFALSLVKHKRVDPAEVARVKKEQVDRVTGLEWYEPDPRGLAGIAGLENLKAWLRERALAFSPEAKTLGVPLPRLRGVILIGPSGTGKSLTAKCAATAFQAPCVRLDLGALKDKWVGSSEKNIREAFKRLRGIRRAVVWVDEVEKALGGGQLDGGVSSDQLGSLLTFLEDIHDEPDMQLFLVATCNDPSGLKPEFLNRFDEAFLLDLPGAQDRAGVLGLALQRYGYDLQAFGSLAPVAALTDGFSGRELDKLVEAAMWRALGDGKRKVRVPDLVACAGQTVPVSRAATKQVQRLREWCKGRTRPASEPESPQRNLSLAGGRSVQVGKEDLCAQ